MPGTDRNCFANLLDVVICVKKTSNADGSYNAIGKCPNGKRVSANFVYILQLIPKETGNCFYQYSQFPPLESTNEVQSCGSFCIGKDEQCCEGPTHDNFYVCPTGRVSATNWS